MQILHCSIIKMNPSCHITRNYLQKHNLCTAMQILGINCSANINQLDIAVAI